jgi:hypothetical protein
MVRLVELSPNLSLLMQCAAPLTLLQAKLPLEAKRGGMVPTAGCQFFEHFHFAAASNHNATTIQSSRCLLKVDFFFIYCVHDQNNFRFDDSVKAGFPCPPRMPLELQRNSHILT